MYETSFDIQAEIDNAGGKLTAHRSSPETERSINNKVYDYCAEFPDSEEFEVKVITGLEDFIARHDTKHVDGKALLYFDVYSS